jgi:hypothetical protein
MTLFICIAAGLVGVAGLGVACWSIQRTHNKIHSRDRSGADLFMPYDIWTSH